MENNYYSNDQELTYVEITAEEEAELVHRFYAGDIAARDALIRNNLRYATSLALKHSSRPGLRAELMSAANLGLIKAIESRNFIPEKGLRFTTFATKYIKGEILACFRVHCGVTFPSGFKPEDDAYDTHMDLELLADDSGFQPSDVDHALLRDALCALTEREQRLVSMVFIEGHSIADAGRALGLTRQWASMLKDRALVKLRLAMGVRQTPEEIESLEEAA